MKAWFSNITVRTPKPSIVKIEILEFQLSKVGFPIRKSVDQSFFAAPHGLSQRSTSFIASQRQGIHRTPLRHLIALIINVHTLGRMLSAHLPQDRSLKARTLDECCMRLDMIRKTSLLRKINPIMRRSSFTKKIIYNPHILQVLPCERRERRNDLEIMNWIRQITLQTQNSDQSPLYDVRNPASRHPGEDERMRSDVSRTTNTRTLKAGIDLQFHLVEPDGIEPTTSCLQSTRSPS